MTVTIMTESKPLSKNQTLIATGKPTVVLLIKLLYKPKVPSSGPK